ncbi:MAG: YdeI/OmpD-associated family protein [Melioribacteraceae bacterium]|nr:YdeI/OmpD-associated family protein [Melioribacteraceae bacterium]
MNIIHKKLLLKPNQKVLLLNCPEDIDVIIQPLPDKSVLSTRIRDSFDAEIIFVKFKKDLMKAADKMIRSLRSDGVLWVAYPRKESGIETDLNRNICIDTFTKSGYSPVSLVSINDNWSCMRFRPDSKISKKNSESLENKKQYIDVKYKTVTAPADLLIELEKNPTIKKFFDSLSYTHKKEYVLWIIEAKKQITRDKRIKKTLEMLGSKKKNPYEGEKK